MKGLALKRLARCEGAKARQCEGPVRPCDAWSDCKADKAAGRRFDLHRIEDNRTFAPSDRTFAPRTLAPSDRFKGLPT